MTERRAYVNGRIVPLSKASVNIEDRGFLYGDGVFETIRVAGGRCVRLERHLARLSSGARTLGIAGLPDAPVLAEAIASVLDANHLTDARVRLTVTRGLAAGPGISSNSAGSPTVVITAGGLPRSKPEPARVIISSISRDERSPLSSVKSLNYLPGILALNEARQAGADDAILLNTCGSVAEGTVGNIFLVKDRTLVTPSLDQGVLAGTVRTALIELASQLGLEVDERAVDPAELMKADEVFLTNAIAIVRPVRDIAGQAVGSGKWPVSEKIREAVLDHG
ncbi:MAG: aminotransferase class IV [Armatimonadota bacterium]